jgi:hypothetical protein
MFFEIGQEHPAHRERRVSAGEPHRRKPSISAADARQQRKLRAGRVVINSFILLDRVDRGAYAHPVVFRDFAGGSLVYAAQTMAPVPHVRSCVYH